MITGHIGVAGLLSRIPRRKLGTAALAALALASVFPDFLDGLFFFIGFCSPYGLYTHTLYSVLLQAAVLGGGAYLITASLPTGVLFATAVVLHLAADFFTGQKLLFPGGEMHGLYFYYHPLWDFALEAPLVVLGWLAARRSAISPSWMTSTWVLAAVLAVQVGFDATMESRTTRKPTACFHATTLRS